MLGATSSINNYMNVFGVQQAQSMEQLTSLLTATQNQLPTDSVDFSSSAMMLQQFLHSEMQSGDDSSGLGEMDMLGLAQLKQRGEMLAGMLQVKMKNFESNLMSNIQGAGLQMQNMDIKNGEDGLMLMGELQNKDILQNVMGGMQGEFMDISRLARVMNMLQQLGPDNIPTDIPGLISAASQYAQQSLPERTVKPPSGDFVMHVQPTGTSFSFE